MIIKNTVKTEQRAIEILQMWLTENITEELLFADTIIEDCEIECECGQTQGKRAFFEGGSKIASVAICDRCGDDDKHVFLEEKTYDEKGNGIWIEKTYDDDGNSYWVKKTYDENAKVVKETLLKRNMIFTVNGKV